jgi:hypothetical protein
MFLGALLEVGVPLAALQAELARIPAAGFRLRTSRATRGGIRGRRVRVLAPDDRGHRRFSEFRRLIAGSRLAGPIQERSLELLKRLFVAEGRVHGEKFDRVHLHELGSLDTLVDVVGAVVGLDLLGVESCEASPVNLGGGEIAMAHGRIAAPAPATVELLKGVPCFSDGSSIERTTPTGALLVSGLARRFGPWPAMTVERTGYGLGSKDPRGERPNVLRAVVGRRAAATGQAVEIMEATIDDMSPEVAGYLMERLLAAGALDVFFVPVGMKKSRPGINLTLIAPLRARDRLAEILFQESTTLGIRTHAAQRMVLERKLVPVATRWGRVPVKLGLAGGRVLTVSPEFEDCRRIAVAKKVPLKEVQQEAMAAFRRGTR